MPKNISTDFLTVSKESTAGIRLDTTSPSFGWRDIIGDVAVKSVGVGNPPTLAAYQGSIYGFQFSHTPSNDEVFNVFHMPHDWVFGSDLFIHAHWSHNSAAVTSGGVTWGFDVTFARGFNQGAFIAPISTSVTQAASTTQYQHLVAEVQLTAASPSASQIDTDLLEVDGIILVRTYLSGNTINGTPSPFLHTVDIHYQSHNLATKEKAPPFYS